MKNTKKLFLILFVCTNSCAVQVPNVRVCSVAGFFTAGADCAYTLSDNVEEMSAQEFVKFLEGDDSHGPALCQSTEDYVKVKTALEQACYKLGNQCTYEIKQAFINVTARLEANRRK